MQVKKQALTHHLSAVSPSGSCRSAALLTDHLSYLLQSAQHASRQDLASNESPGRTNNGLWCWGNTETQKHKHTPEHWVCASVCLKGAATALSERSKKSESFPQHNKQRSCVVYWTIGLLINISTLQFNLSECKWSKRSTSLLYTEIITAGGYVFFLFFLFYRNNTD